MLFVSRFMVVSVQDLKFSAGFWQHCYTGWTYHSFHPNNKLQIDFTVCMAGTEFAVGVRCIDKSSFTALLFSI